MLRCLITCGLLGAVMSLDGGCVALHAMDDYPLLVVDGETGEPLAGAEVELRNSGWRALDFSRTQRTTSDEAGHALVRVLPRCHGSSRVAVKAEGYIDLTLWLGTDEAQRWLVEEQVDGQTVRRVPLYRGPAPKLAIVLPDDYRGPLFVDLHLDESADAQAGEREFVARPNDAGYVRVDAPPLLWRELHPWPEHGAMQVRYANGEVIPFGSRGYHAGAVYVRSGEPVRVRPLDRGAIQVWPANDRIELPYIVGTQADEAAFYAEIRVMINRIFEHATAGD